MAEPIHYVPKVLAERIFDELHRMETRADAHPKGSRFRTRCGLICAPEFFEGKVNGGTVENAITKQLAKAFPNARAQVRGFAQGGSIPDIVLACADDAGRPLDIVLEAKPVWQRWITTGVTHYSGVQTDSDGRSTGGYCSKNIQQVAGDGSKLISQYSASHHRHLLLALVFQRPGEVDESIVRAVGPGWDHAKRHIPDMCNPPGDDIGCTAMIFWPSSEAT